MRLHLGRDGPGDLRSRGAKPATTLVVYVSLRLPRAVHQVALRLPKQPLALPRKMLLTPFDVPPRFAPTDPLPRLPHSKTSEIQ